jgi:hypothetical protein
MAFWDDISTAWNDVNAFLQPVAEFIDPWADLIPGFQAAENILGIDPAKWTTQSGQSIFQPTVAAPPVFGGGQAQQGGASMEWNQLGVPAAMAWTGPRRIMPYTGGIIPSGFRVANRAARRPTQGYPAGTYLVPRRRMNPLNPRALMRAERRMGAFTRFVKSHFQLSSIMPKRKKSARFGARRRRK